MAAVVTPPATAKTGVTDVTDRDPRPVVFFDGLCGLCDGTVSTLVRLDKQGKLAFATLQGRTAEGLPDEYVTDLRSMVLRVGSELYRKSTAVGHTLLVMGGGWAALGRLLLFVPRPLRDFGYDVVAKYRYRVWGKRDTCRMPTPEERSRFLD